MGNRESLQGFKRSIRANGHTENPTYEEVCTDTTGHRETVKVTYDTEKITLNKILKAYFMVIDPTVKDKQGGDTGTQYQTGVYYEDEESLPVIRDFFEEERKKYDVFCVELLPLSCFWTAEEYHQDYLDKNPTGYCHITKVEMDKVLKLNEEE